MSNFYKILTNNFFGQSKKLGPVTEELINSMKSYYLENSHLATFIPIRAKGFFKKGPLLDNKIENVEDISQYHALAILPQNINVGVIDLDNCSEDTTDFRKCVKENITNLCIIYHANTDLPIDEIVNTKKFKILVKPDEKLKKLERLKVRLSMLQIEVAYYEKKPFTIIGRHRREETEYRFATNIQNLIDLKICPTDIVYCLKKIALSSRTTFKGNVNNCTNLGNGQQGYLFKEVSENIFYNGLKELGTENTCKIEERFNEAEKRDEIWVTGQCPNSHMHTTLSHSKEFTLKYYKASKTVYLGCFHNSCYNENINLGYRLFKKNLTDIT